MNTSFVLFLKLLRNYKTYAAVAAAVVSGIGMILSKNYDQGLETIFQAMLVLFSGASAVGLHAASVAKADRP
ncbi:hypothetical protein [Planctomyces sp. SH-PL62]|uniref:hypothetical protein n=1 Tax=Planctomyces sp. SH-PL62 TaxID=1636152 RepID=UPI00078CC61A|nr:hypothetical protein [Planctomyces sp. SH-PL62]AMV37351.1 hypothetical protein VT85_07950 [Planctomyces sp. SH-PL62]